MSAAFYLTKEEAINKIRRNEIQRVDLRANRFFGSKHGRKIGDSGAIQLANAFKKNTSVVILSLAYNDFGIKGLEKLLDVLKDHPSLQELNLSNNYNIDDQCAQLILNMVKKNKTIQRVLLHRTSVSQSLANEISKIVLPAEPDSDESSSAAESDSGESSSAAESDSGIEKLTEKFKANKLSDSDNDDRKVPDKRPPKAPKGLFQVPKDSTKDTFELKQAKNAKERSKVCVSSLMKAEAYNEAMALLNALNDENWLEALKLITSYEENILQSAPESSSASISS